MGFARSRVAMLPVCDWIVYMLHAMTIALGRAMAVGCVRRHNGQIEDFAFDEQLV